MKKQLDFLEDGRLAVSTIALAKTRFYDLTQLAYRAFHADRPTSGILPSSSAVRWASKDSMSFLLERPPKEITLNYVMNDRVCRAIINMPWIEQFFTFSKNLHEINNVWLFARPTPIGSEEDDLFEIGLPPTILGGVQAPRHFLTDYAYLIKESLKKAPFDLSVALSLASKQLWGTQFNLDNELNVNSLPDELRIYWPDAVSIINAWADLPMKQVLELHYPRFKWNVGEMCNNVETEKVENHTSTASFIESMAGAEL